MRATLEFKVPFSDISKINRSKSTAAFKAEHVTEECKYYKFKRKTYDVRDTTGLVIIKDKTSNLLELNISTSQ